MSLKLTYQALRGELGEAIRDIEKPIAVAATGAIKDAAEYVKLQGRAHIASAGFGKAWQNAFRVDVYPKHGVAVDPALFAHHNIPYAGVFEEGATIQGSPLLWIPVKGLPARVGGRRLTPKTYIDTIGPLHYFKSRRGVPILAAFVAGKPGARITLAKLRVKLGTHGLTSTPIFFGVRAVNIKAKFGLALVFERAEAGLAAGYVSHLEA